MAGPAPFLAVAALVPVLAAGAGAEATPDPAWWVRTALDLDRDGVDDAIEDARGRLRVLLSYAEPPGEAERREAERAGAVVFRGFHLVPVLAAEVEASSLARVAAADGVVLVELDRPLAPTLDRSGPQVGADRARSAAGVSGRGVTIAVLDTGADFLHPDLAGRIVGRFDATLPDLVHGLSPLEVPVVPELTSGHGTHVAGIAAGSGAASDGRYRGISPGASMVNIKVFDLTGEGSSSFVLSALDWIMVHREALNIRVALMSLGGDPTDGTDALSRAVDAAADRGLLSVVAAGNRGPDPGSVGTPGVAARALTVGAVDRGLQVAGFSGRGPTSDGRQKPDLAAPGVGIVAPLPLVTSLGEYYGPVSGTSMAAPHVAGGAALMFEANASLTPALAKWLLMVTSRGVGPSPQEWDPGVGWGFVDLAAAVRGAEDLTSLSASPLVERVPFDEPLNPWERLRFAAQETLRGVGALEMSATLVAVAAAALGVWRGRRAG